MLCRATQDGQFIVESSDKWWSIGGGNGNSLQYSCWKNSINSMKRPKDMIPEDELSGSQGVQYATGEEWRAVTNSSRKNDVSDLKWKWCSVVDVSGDRSKIHCSKKQYCIGTWNVKSMNHSKLDMVKKKMARLNIDILGISKLKWMGMGEFNSDDHYIYYCGQESLEEME